MFSISFGVCTASIVALMPLNWYLESKKWQISLQTIYKVALKEALRDVLIGVATGFFTPARLGEIAGRALLYDKKASVAALAISNSFAQSVVTFSFGTVGLFYFGLAHLNLPLVYIAFFALLVVFVMYFLLLKFKYLHQLKVLFRIRLFFSVLMLSFSRYCIFLVQFYVAFMAFSFQPSFLDLCMGVGVYYLLQSFLPVFSFAEIVTKASVATVIFPLIGMPIAAGVGSALLVYISNMTLPVLVGNVLIHNEI